MASLQCRLQNVPQRAVTKQQLSRVVFVCIASAVDSTLTTCLEGEAKPLCSYMMHSAQTSTTSHAPGLHAERRLRAPVTQNSIMFGRIGLKFEIWKNPISAAEVCLARTGVLCHNNNQHNNTGHAYVSFLSVLHRICMVFGGAGTIGSQNLCCHVAVYYCL